MSLVPVNSRPPVDLEKVVRPLVTSAPKPDRARLNFAGGVNVSGEQTNTEGQGVPVLKWSAVATVQVTTLAAMGFTVLEADNSEINRQTHVQRITQADNPDNFVDVEVIDKIAFQNAAGVKATYKYNNPGDA